MQFITHRDPVNVGGWATALGATGDAISNLLKIYTNYEQTKKMDAQQALENKFKQDEMDMRREAADRQRAQQDLQNQLSARNIALQEAEAGIVPTAPTEKIGEETVDAAPDFQLQDMANAHKPEATATDFTGVDTKIDTRLAPPAVSPNDLFKMQYTQPTRTEDVMGPNTAATALSAINQGGVSLPGLTYADLSGMQDQKHQRAGDIPVTPEILASLPPALQQIYAGQKWLPATIVPTIAAGDFRAAATEAKPLAAPKIETIGGRDKQWDAANGQWIDLGEHDPNATNKDQFAPDVAAMITAIKPMELNTIPPQYRAQVKAIAEGREPMPNVGNRPNSPGAMLMAMVTAYDPRVDKSQIQARYNADKELSRGGPTSRGGQVTNLNTFADHANILQSKADALDKTWGTGPFSTINWAIQGVKPSAFSGEMKAYETAADTFIGEYIKTLKGAAPTNEETRMFEKLRDTTLAPAARQQIIDTLISFVESRANQQESWYYQTFGVNSWDDDAKRPFFEDRYWEHSADGTWKVKKGVHQPAAGGKGPSGEKPKDPAGIR